MRDALTENCISLWTSHITCAAALELARGAQLKLPAPTECVAGGAEVGAPAAGRRKLQPPRSSSRPANRRRVRNQDTETRQAAETKRRPLFTNLDERAEAILTGSPLRSDAARSLACTISGCRQDPVPCGMGPP